jgi:hypothetical protein
VIELIFADVAPLPAISKAGSQAQPRMPCARWLTLLGYVYTGRLAGERLLDGCLQIPRRR